MMKKILLIFSALITMLFVTENVSAANSTNNQNQIKNSSKSDFYAYHPVNKSCIDSDSIKYTVLGYQYLKNPIPSKDHQARFLLVKCEINTKDLDSKYTPYITNDFLKVKDDRADTANVTYELSKKRLKRPPFTKVRDEYTNLNVKPNKVYQIDTCVVVYPYDNIELDLCPDNETKEVITVHKVKSSNGIVMDKSDPLRNYDKEADTDASND